VDRPTKQVMIEARLVEVTANPRQSYGINWAGVLGGSGTPQTLKYGGSTPATTRYQTDINPVTGASTTSLVPDRAQEVRTVNGKFDAQDFLMNGMTRGGFGDAIGGQFAILSAPALSVTLRLLNEDADAEFLAHPRIVTSNNLEAKITITRAQPVPQLNFNEQTAQAVFSGFQDKEFGNTLTVTPSINKDGFISMKVKPEISNKVGDATFAFGGATVTSPVIDKRTLDSNVLIHSGDTLAIGGLLQDEQTKGRAKVPVLGDVPLLGYLFQEKLNQRNKRNLLIFVTPTIIEQGYGTGLEDQVTGITHSGEEYADPNGWRNNAKGAKRLVPTSARQLAADYPKPGVAPAPKKSRR
jgi:type II secretory pathway component GspD/PulD (secretin)